MLLVLTANDLAPGDASGVTKDANKRQEAAATAALRTIMSVLATCSDCVMR